MSNPVSRLISYLVSPSTPAAKAKAAEEKSLAEQRQKVTIRAAAASSTPRRRGGRPATPTALLPEASPTSPTVFVRMPDGRIANHGWQLLRPTSLYPLLRPNDEELAGALLNDEQLNLFGDDAGNVLRHISPRHAQEQKLFYELDDRFYTTLAVKEWPRTGANPGMWRFFFGGNMAIKVPEASLSLHHWRIGIGPAERSLRKEMEKRVNELTQLRMKEVDSARVAGLEQELEEIKRGRQAVIHQQDTLFHVSCYIRVSGSSLEELKGNVLKIEEMARGMDVKLLQLPGEQRRAFVSSMPYASDPAYLTKLRGSSKAAELLPLVTSKHQERNRNGHNPVVLYGIHAVNFTPVIMSPFNSDETNEITTVLGKPGSGKSYWLRTHLGRLAMAGVQTITIDPLGDFVRWHKSNDGVIIEIAPGSPYHVNPLKREVEAETGELESIDTKIQRLLPLFRLLLAKSWNELASGLIGSGLRAFYEEYGEQERLMEDFIKSLRTVDASVVGAFSASTLRQRDDLIDTLATLTLTGGLKEFFAHPTNVPLDPRDPKTKRILFNLAPSGEGDNLVFAAYLAVTMAVNIAKRSTERKIIMIDEIHKLFAAQRTAEAISESLQHLVRERRHWNTTVTFATQFVDEDATNRSQEALLKTAGIWVLLKATTPMLEQTAQLARVKDPWLLNTFLRSEAAVDEAKRIAPKEMIVIRNERVIPMFSVGLSFEDAEDDKRSGVYKSQGVVDAPPRT